MTKKKIALALTMLLVIAILPTDVFASAEVQTRGRAARAANRLAEAAASTNTTPGAIPGNVEAFFPPANVRPPGSADNWINLVDAVIQGNHGEVPTALQEMSIAFGAMEEEQQVSFLETFFSGR